MNVRFVIVALIVVSGLELPNRADESTRISFNRDIRPILSNNCFFCHGQDSANRKAEMRLDTEEGQRANHVVVPGSLDESLLIERVLSEDPDVVMPPLDSNKQLSNQDRELLKRWMLEGAAFEEHWSWIAPQRTLLSEKGSAPLRRDEKTNESDSPPMGQTPFRNHPIDAFVYEKLEEHGLEPSPEADRTTLIRRVTLDLTGLPPTPDEVDAFLSDASDNAYEEVVDRLLRSPHFGERMALPWLDAARYADTHGYQKDNHRSMWLWRDWVVKALNENMPFDQFTIEQLAGDLIENASPSQRIATGFNRNHRINAEAGSIEEEFLAEYAADRVETTATVWLGLTIGCARCHDHKFDSITQKDFYQLVAFFNNIEEKGVDGVGSSPGPEMQVTIPGFENRIEVQRKQIARLSEQLAARARALSERRREWEKGMEAAVLSPEASAIWNVPQSVNFTSTGKMEFEKLPDSSVLVKGDNPLNDVHAIELPLESGNIQSIRLEAMRHPSLTDNGFARNYDGSFVLSGFEIELNCPGVEPQELKIEKVVADSERSAWPVLASLDDHSDTGWSIDPNDHREIHQAIFTLGQPIAGQVGVSLTIRLHYESKEEQSIIGRFRLAFNASRQADLNSQTWLPSSVVAALLTPAARRSSEQQQQIVDAFIQSSDDPELSSIRQELHAASDNLNRLIEQSSVTVMVMKEAEKPRQTFVNLRGAYDNLGEQVFAAVPSSLPRPARISDAAPLNRLDLARWLVAPENPLTARVAVNRYWQMYFGNGLVKTTEDFGTQGDWPSHPELLDWLCIQLSACASLGRTRCALRAALPHGLGSTRLAAEADSRTVPRHGPSHSGALARSQANGLDRGYTCHLGWRIRENNL